MDLRDKADEYLAGKEGLWADSTLKSARARLNTLLRLSRSLEPKVIFDKLTAEGSNLYSIKQALIIAAQFEIVALETDSIQRWLTRNSYVFRNCYKEKTKLLTTDEYTEMLHTAEHNPGLYNMIVLMGEAGLRKSEALAATWKDLKDNCLKVIGKGGKQRLVPISKSRLRRIVGSSRICGTRNGCHYYLQKSPHTFHDLRAFFATRLVNTPGINLRDAQLLLGHSSIVTTQKYLRSDFERIKKVLVGL